MKNVNTCTPYMVHIGIQSVTVFHFQCGMLHNTNASTSRIDSNARMQCAIQIQVANWHVLHNILCIWH